MLWKFILVNSNNLSAIGELSQATDKKLDIVLNKSGSATFSYPMDTVYSEAIEPFKTGIKVVRWNRLKSMIAGRSVWDTMWSGYVLPIEESVGGNKMSISCVGWLQRLAKRMVRRERIYTNLDDGEIVRLLLEEVNTNPSPGDGYPVLTPSGSNPATPTWLAWGGTQPNEGAGGATAYVTTTRSKTVQRYQNVLPVIEELTGIENGGDIVVNPDTRVVTWHRRYRRLKDDVVFGFQWGPQNLKDFSRSIESDSRVNYLVCTGAPGTIPQFAHDQPQQSEIGLLEENVVLSDVKSNDVLLAYAGGEVLVRSNGRITYTATPFTVQHDRASGVPEALIDYREGDQARLVAVHPPRIDVRGQAIRVFGISISIDNNGVGSLGPLQIAP